MELELKEGGNETSLDTDPSQGFREADGIISSSSLVDYLTGHADVGCVVLDVRSAGTPLRGAIALTIPSLLIRRFKRGKALFSLTAESPTSAKHAQSEADDTIKSRDPSSPQQILGALKPFCSTEGSQAALDSIQVSLAQRSFKSILFVVVDQRPINGFKHAGPSNESPLEETSPLEAASSSTSANLTGIQRRVQTAGRKQRSMDSGHLEVGECLAKALSALLVQPSDEVKVAHSFIGDDPARDHYLVESLSYHLVQPRGQLTKSASDLRRAPSFTNPLQSSLYRSSTTTNGIGRPRPRPALDKVQVGGMARHLSLSTSNGRTAPVPSADEPISPPSRHSRSNSSNRRIVTAPSFANGSTLTSHHPTAGLHDERRAPVVTVNVDGQATDLSAAFDVSTIIPGSLYLGGEPTQPEHFDILRSLGVTWVLNMATEIDPEPALTFAKSSQGRYLKVEMQDLVEEKDIFDKVVVEGCQFIEQARAATAPVFVHCKAGKSRSVTVILAYLILLKRWPLSRAYVYLSERRESICPNIGFVAELMRIEERITGRKSAGVNGVMTGDSHLSSYPSEDKAGFGRHSEADLSPADLGPAFGDIGLALSQQSNAFIDRDLIEKFRRFSAADASSAFHASTFDDSRKALRRLTAAQLERSESAEGGLTSSKSLTVRKQGLKQSISDESLMPSQ